MNKTMAALIDRVADALFRVEEHLEIEAAFPTLDLDTNLAFLADLREQKARLVAAENEVERLVASQMPAKTYTVGNLTAERGANSKTVWDVRPAAWAVVEPACVDQNTGEVLIEEKHAWALVDRLLSAARVTYFLSGVLKEMGLDPDDYRQREGLRRTVKVTRVEKPSKVVAP